MKLITIYLTMSDIPDKVLANTTYSLKDFQKAIKKEKTDIHTTQTKAISAYYYDKGYDIKVVSENKTILFSELLKDEENRQVRPTQNWEKMVLSGCFNIKSDWEHI